MDVDTYLTVSNHGESSTYSDTVLPLGRYPKATKSIPNLSCD